MEGFLKVLLVLSFFASIGFGIFFIIQVIRKRQWKKPFLLALGLFITCGIITSFLPPSQKQTPPDTQKNEASTNAKSLAEWDADIKKQSDNNKNIIKKALAVDDTIATNVNDILFRLGIKNITSLDEYHPTIGSTLSSPELGNAIAVVYFNSDKQIDRIIFKNNTLYEDGKIVNKIETAIISDKEKTDATIKSRAAIKTKLGKNFVEFPQDPIVGKSNNIIQAFGAVIVKDYNGTNRIAKYSVKFNNIWKIEELTIN